MRLSAAIYCYQNKAIGNMLLSRWPLHNGFKRCTAVIAFCLLSIVSLAQNFSYKAKVNSSTSSGFHKIILTPDIASVSSSQYEDLRLFDNTGKEVPFLVRKDENKSISAFIEYPITNNKSDDVWQTVTIQNEDGNNIDHLLLAMKNADADRTVRTSGSNDNTSWFVVKDNFYFSAYDQETDETTIYKQLSFPKTNYKYYKIDIKNKNKNPLNILKAGYFKNSNQGPQFQVINGLSYTRKDSNKKTYLYFTISPSNRIDELEFNITSPTLYKRNGIIIQQQLNENDESNTEKDIISSSKKYRQNYNSNSEPIEFNSDKNNKISLPYFFENTKISQFTIEIENNDNEPLQFESIKAYQLTTTLIADLQKDKTYILYTGDSLLTAPSYDLVYFTNKLSDTIPTIQIEKVQPKEVKLANEYNNKNEKYYVWIGLGIVALILLFLTSSMLKNMKKKEVNE
jgi:hypothetical protein